MKTNTRRLAESAMLIAVAIVLELISKTFIPEQPFGGQLTIVSMLPIVLISYRHGVRWGLLSAFAYSLLETVIGMGTVSAAFLPNSEDYMGTAAFLMLALDYLLAFTVLGIGGCFRDRIRKPGLSLMCGSLAALGSRYLCHILSGTILYGAWAESFFTQDGFPAWGTALAESLNPTLLSIVYSVVYNGMFMIPEILCTAVAALILGRVPQIVSKLD